MLLFDEVGRARLDAGDVRGALDAAERGLAVDVLNEGLWRLALETEWQTRSPRGNRRAL